MGKIVTSHSLRIIIHLMKNNKGKKIIGSQFSFKRNSVYISYNNLSNNSFITTNLIIQVT